MSNLTQTVDNKFSFVKLQLEELLELREAKVLSKTAYIHLALKFEQPYEEKELLIEINSFCEKWKVSRADYYRCLRKLKEIGSSILARLVHVVKFDRRKKVNEKTISQTGRKTSVTEKSESPVTVTKCVTKNVSKPSENPESSSLRLKENNTFIEEDENKNTTFSEEEIDVVSNEIPDKPYEHESLVRFVTNAFVVKYGETRENARKNAVAHLRDKKKAEKRWNQYLESVQSKKRAEERYEKTLSECKRLNSIPVNKTGLEMINNFLRGLKT